MRVGAKFLILVFFSLYQCQGAPAGEASTKKRGITFTAEEDALILQEVSRLLVGNQHLCSKAIWEEVANTHREKWIQNTPGFPQERSQESLLRHFRSKLMPFCNSELNTNVPENLLERFRPDLNKPPLSGLHLYSTEEKDFIMEELLKPSCTSLFATSTWNTIREKHDMKRQSDTPGFLYERTVEGLRSYIETLKENGQLPDDVKKKFWKTEKGTRPVYTKAEEDFIIEELLKPTCNNIFAKSTLQAITEKHDEKRRRKTPGFENERTLYGLRSHVKKMKGNGRLPGEVLRKIRSYEKGTSSSNPTPWNQRTDLEVPNQGDTDEEID